MSLLAFQRALADLAASPALCRAARKDAAAALAGYALDARELRRAAAAAAQPGMAVTCTLHRSNRLAVIVAMLPLTVHLLGPALGAAMDGFWGAHPTPPLATRRELHRFGAWLRRALAEGAVAAPFAGPVLEAELAQYDLGMAPRRLLLARVDEWAARFPDGPLEPHPLVRVIRFGHDVAALFPLLARRAPLPYQGIAAGEHYLLVDARGGGRSVRPLDLPTGRALHALAHGRAAEVGDAERRALLAAGLLVHAAPREVAEAA